MRFFLYLWIGIFLASAVASFGVGLLIRPKPEDIQQDFVKRYLYSAQEVLELQTLEVSGIAEYHYKEEEQHFLSAITNPLFSKEYHFYIPFQAVYGISLKDVECLKFFQSKIYVYLPPPKLLHFDFQLHQKKIFRKEGWLIFQKEDKFSEFEKRIYEKQKNELLNSVVWKEKALQQAQNSIRELLKPLNMPIEWANKRRHR